MALDVSIKLYTIVTDQAKDEVNFYNNNKKKNEFVNTGYACLVFHLYM